MADGREIICPFYGVSEDLCDVGCGYISPSDVTQIIRYCRAHHEDCSKFQQLSVRSARPRSSSVPAVSAGADRPQVACQVTSGESAAEERVLVAPAGSSAAASLVAGETAARVGVSSPLGLLSSGMAVLLLGLQQAGLLPLDTMTVAVSMFYCGLATIISGILEWRRNNGFTASAFCAYGLFWLTLVGMHALPRAGIGDPPGALAIGSYLILWGLFSAVLFVGALQHGRMLSLVFANFTLFLVLFSLSEASGLPVFDLLAGWQGVLTGVLAVYAGGALLLNDVYRRPILPV